MNNLDAVEMIEFCMDNASLIVKDADVDFIDNMYCRINAGAELSDDEITRITAIHDRICKVTH